MVKPLQNHDDRYLPRNAYERRYGRDITREESWAMLDEWCREYLDIGVDDFARRYHAGEYDDPDDDPKIMELAMRLEFLERNPPVKQQPG
jgi:hypothetical protein